MIDISEHPLSAVSWWGECEYGNRQRRRFSIEKMLFGGEVPVLANIRASPFTKKKNAIADCLGYQYALT